MNQIRKKRKIELVSINHCSADTMPEWMDIDSMLAVRSYARQFTLDKITDSLLFTCYHCKYMTGVCGIMTTALIRAVIKCNPIHFTLVIKKAWSDIYSIDDHATDIAKIVFYFYMECLILNVLCYFLNV